MNWRTKAFVQNVVSSLPQSVSEPIYYRLQRRFGVLNVGYMRQHFHRVSEIVKYILKTGRSVSGKTFLEIGTGRTVNIPLGLWLCGAGNIYTVDLNRYLREDLMVECVDYLEENADEMMSLLGPEAMQERLDQLFRCKRDLRSIMGLTQIVYHAPADAAALLIPSNSIDYHYSVSVLEHVPPVVIKTILQEAKRLLAPDGLSVHLIDPSDHFAHSDRSITLVNFLQFDEAEWAKVAGNKYAYHNRLRIYELLQIFSAVGMRLVEERRYIDDRAVEILRAGFGISDGYKGKDIQDLATCRVDIVGDFK